MVLQLQQVFAQLLLRVLTCLLACCADLFIAGGELMERMISAHAAVIASLK